MTVNFLPTVKDSLNVVIITFGDTMTLDIFVGAAPTNDWVLTIEESVNVNPPLITNISLAFGVGVATPMVI